MKRAGGEGRRVAFRAVGAGKKLLSLNWLSVGEAAPRGQTEKGHVASHFIQVRGGEFVPAAGIPIEHRKDRGGHAHVVVQRAGDLVTETRFPAFVIETAKTRLAG